MSKNAVYNPLINNLFISKILLMRKAVYQGLSDLLINLSAGWFGMIVVSPVLTNDIVPIFKNLTFGITYFILGIKLKEKQQNL